MPPRKKVTNQEPAGPQPKNTRALIVWVSLMVVTLFVIRVVAGSLSDMGEPMTYSELYATLEAQPQTPRIERAVLVEDRLTLHMEGGERFRVQLPPEDPELLLLLRTRVNSFEVKPAQTPVSGILMAWLPLLFILGIMWFLMRGMQGGGRLMQFGKSRAKLVSENKVQVTFRDVAGVDEAKEELQEIIEFLKAPKRFTRLGGRIPKGVLLMGPPGTGKTLLAKAVAGEAGVPFFSISGSDFVEMFVGVGASRVRDLFETARKSAKTSGRGCIIFMDEIDAVGRQRFAGIGGGHDEREQTLNAILVEMDGFDTDAGVILMAATNRPDVLDPALLRPGRFDRRVVIDRPDIQGREAILKVHMRNVTLAPGVDLISIAKQTPGFSGADLANLVNEAALMAARQNKKAVHLEQLEEAIERVMAGPERKSRVIGDHEKKVTAYHESGHTLVALFTPHADPLHKVSIIPRGTQALGYTMQLPTEDRYTMTRVELMARLSVMMGGRVAEELIFGEPTTGAQNDIEVATGVARRMVCEFGMSEKLGCLTFGQRNNQVFLGRDLFEERNYSEKTAMLIDDEIRAIIDECYAKAQKIITEHREDLERLATKLLEKEVLDREEVQVIVGYPKPQPEPAPSTPAS